MPADDLFGDPAAETPPAAADDLFGEPAAETPPAAADDLFGEPAAEAAAPAGADDLFGEPAGAAAPAADESLDDLFGAPEPANAEEATPTAADDLFGQVAPAAQQRLGMRHWSDNTGNFTVDGQLVEILHGKVRLLKENGRTCTVEMRRLSKIDAEYVQQIVAIYGRGLLGAQLATR
jgi:hypothetical protein